MFGLLKRIFGKAPSTVTTFNAAHAAPPAPAVTAAAIVSGALSSSKYEFRSRTALSRKLANSGFDPALLDDILGIIGTRTMPGNTSMVGLISRIGARPRRWSQLG